MEEHKFLDISKLLHCGVYALLKKGVVIYVGKSTKPLARLSTHYRNRGRPVGNGPSIPGSIVNGKGVNFDGIWFLPCMLGQLGILEDYFIRKYLPKLNCKGMPARAIPDDIKALLANVVTITGLPQEDSPKVYIRRML